MNKINEKLTFFYYMEESLWDEKVDANRYFGTISILFAAVIGALTGGGSALKDWFNLSTELSLTAAIGTCIVIWGLNVAESIVASTNALTAFLRSLLMAFCIAVAFGLGHLLAVVVIAIVCFVLVVMFGWAVLTGTLGLSSSGKKQYLVDENGKKTEVTDGPVGTKVDASGRSYEIGADGKYHQTY